MGKTYIRRIKRVHAAFTKEQLIAFLSVQLEFKDKLMIAGLIVDCGFDDDLFKQEA